MVATVAVGTRQHQRALQVLEPPMTWFAPQPLWRAIPREELATRRGQPVILRFASDRFMDELAMVLNSESPENLASYVAQPETWRNPRVGWVEGRDVAGSLKLYQPAHNRYYLVAGVLACRRPGIPDRTIDQAAGESVFFVLRRLHNGVEYGWATGQAEVANTLGLVPGGCMQAGPNGTVPGHPGYQRSTRKGWLPLADPAHTRLCDEERFPLFPVYFQQDGVTRRLLAGLVPTGSRETYAAEPSLSPLPSGDEYDLPGGDPRPMLFAQQVTGPLMSLWAWYDALRAGAGVGTADQRQIERTSAYILLDLMGLLHEHVPSIYNRIMTGAGSIPASAQDLWDLIRFTELGSKLLTTVMREIEEHRDALEALEADDELDEGWVFPMVGTDPDLDEWVELPDTATRAETTAEAAVQVFFEAALSQPYRPPTGGPLADAPEVPKLDPQSADQYIIRLVYDRPQCPFPVLSERSRPFSLAPFFDPDAPVRPMRVAMPVDTSPEGLRKFPKGVGFQLSNQLRAQMERVVDLKKLMDGEVGEEQSFDLGMICSFSIPIITICALILLMIIVQLLNIIFWWLPFFKICLPLKLSR